MTRQYRKGDERGIDRLVTFGDAVVAIAITLVALPLVDEARLATSAAEFLSHNNSSLFAAGISFIAISSFWQDHHWLLARASAYTRGVIRAELIWLASIVCLPIATVLVYAVQDDRLSSGLYLGIMLTAMIAVRVEGAILARIEALDSEESCTRDTLSAWVPAVLMLIATIAAVTIPGIGLKALFLLLLSWPTRIIVRRIVSVPDPKSRY